MKKECRFVLYDDEIHLEYYSKVDKVWWLEAKGKTIEKTFGYGITETSITRQFMDVAMLERLNKLIENGYVLIGTFEEDSL